jgi:hypothetical protein
MTVNGAVQPFALGAAIDPAGSICPVNSRTSQRLELAQPRPRQAPLGIAANSATPLGGTAQVPDQTISGSRICTSHL